MINRAVFWAVAALVCIGVVGCADFEGRLADCIDAGLCVSADAGGGATGGGIGPTGGGPMGGGGETGGGGGGPMGGGSGGGGPLSRLDVSPLALLFPEVEVDAGVQDLVVNVRNGGEVALTGLSANLTGSAAFSLVSMGACGARLDVDAGCGVPVRYTPTVGAQSGSLVINTNEGAPGTVSLSASAFARAQLSVIVSGMGGRVVSGDAGISCDAGATCSQWVRVGQQVPLRLRPDPFFGLSSWGGPCADAGVPTCTVNVGSDVSVSATFARLNLVFLTNQKFNGNLDGGNGATVRCVAAAIDAGLPQASSYVAWLGDPLLPTASTAPSRMASSRGWARTDGLPIADTAADLMAGRFIYPPNLTESGRREGVDRVWTGYLSDGGVAPGTCTSWSNATTTQGGQLGLSSSSGDAWTQSREQFCAGTYSLYCIGTGANARPVVDEVPPAARRAFLSSPVAGNLNNAAADLHCQGEATTAGLPGASRYKVLRSDATTAGLSRFNLDGGTWYRLDDVVWATPASLASTTLTPATPLDVLANGQRVPETTTVPVWTGGSIRVASTALGTCSSWSDNSPSVGGFTGNARAAGNEASYDGHAFIPPVGGGYPCNQLFRIYCVQD